MPGRFAAMASPIASDVAAIDAWWRKQDPTRTLRFDLYPFPGCTSGAAELDLADVTLSHPASYYANEPVFSKILGDLTSVPYRATNELRKYVVYWDAPTPNARVCGQGNGSGFGPGYAIVYMQACGAVVGNGDLAAVTVTHELLHALGAVAPGAPHECARPNDGHVCDDTVDILYPFLNFGLDRLLLDVNHDDYYGNGGANDIRSSPWLVRLDVPRVPLTVATGGAGQGRVTSDAGAIDCPGACASTQEQGSQVILTATPAQGSRFTGWTGACKGTAQCVVTLQDATSVAAVFAPDVLLGLRVAVRGKGRVVSSPAGVSCPGRCSGSFSAGTALTLRAVPAKGYVLRAWSGACRGKGACKVTLRSASSVRATFVPAA